MDVEHIPKNQLSPQMIKRPPATIVHKDPQSYQPCKTNHVENGQEVQSIPSDQLKKDLLNQREDVYHQRCLLNLLCRTPQKNLKWLSSSHPLMLEL